jgi:uncharacterized membrane-anchored protein YitT (DUF2179 family)
MMKSLFLRLSLKSLKQVLWNLFLILLGSSLCAIAINGILIPHKFLSGGVTGLVLIIHYLVPSLSVAILYALLNVPVFALGWMYVGRRFFLYSLAGTAIFSGALAWVHVSLPVHDILSSALLAGIISGVGVGIILKSLGSAGGTDILSVALLKRFSIRLGTTSLAFNSGVLVAGALLFPLDKALYTLIYIYVSTRILDLVVTGLSQRKAVYIISQRWEEISHKILEDIHRGVTIVQGQGAYTGKEEKILYTVVNFREVSRMKQLIRGIDSKAFVVVSDTLEVMGHRIGNQPQW